MSGYGTLKHNILEHAAQDHIPVVGEFELTPRCNFRCPMCYIRVDATAREKSTGWWKSLFAAAVDAGLLYALLTGGETLIRSDFIELYEYLYDLGVKITVYTNGSLLSGAVIGAFRQRPPEFVGITLYGANEETYTAVTSNPTAFHQVDEAIDNLQQAGIDVAVRTIPIRSVYEHLDLLIAYAKNKNLRLGYQLYVGPKRQSEAVPSTDRLAPTELADFEARILAAFRHKNAEPLDQDTKHATCPALKSGYFITWEGRMQPCALVSTPGKTVEPETFLDTFQFLNQKLLSLPGCLACADCGLYEHCLQCHARRTLEGNASQCSNYLKAVAEARRNKIHE